MKKLLVLTIPLGLAACGGDVVESPTQTIVSAPVQLDPISEQPLPVTPPAATPPAATPPAATPPAATPPAATPPTIQKPAAQTGSVYLIEEPTLLAQNHMPTIYMQIPKLMGTETLQTLKVDIKEPPKEISPCYGAVLTHNIPVVDKQYQYNGWWLLGTLNNTNANFYWATQISNTQIGAVPTGYSNSMIGDPPLDVKFDLGYAQLPYQWVSRLGYYSGFPVNPDEKCTG